MFNFNTFKSEYKKHFKNNSVFLKNQKGGITEVVLLSVILILSLAVLVYYLLIKELIPEEFFYMSIVALLGWLFAFLTGLFHTRQNREDNLIIQNNEIKKRLEIEAFKEINKVIVENEEILTDIATYYVFTWKLKIENSIKNKKPNNSEIVLETHTLTHIHLEAREQNTRLIELWKNFIISIETYEIVLIRFNKFKEVLNKEFRKMLSMTNDFENYIIKLSRKTLLKGDLATLDEKMSEIDNKIMDISCYLRDYRIEIMNSMLGDIFHSKVSKRKVKEPHKTLTQIAKDIYKDS